MYDQNTGEFIPEAETQPTTVNPQETQIQQNQPQPQYPNNQQVSVINNIQQAKSNGIGTAGFVFCSHLLPLLLGTWSKLGCLVFRRYFFYYWLL